MLAFARGTRVAAVMLFSQRMTQADEEDMAAMTRQLIDAALDARRQLLPAVPPARRAAPRSCGRTRASRSSVARKRHYDPGLLFRNTMWDRYFAHEPAADPRRRLRGALRRS